MTPTEPARKDESPDKPDFKRCSRLHLYLCAVVLFSIFFHGSIGNLTEGLVSPSYPAGNDVPQETQQEGSISSTSTHEPPIQNKQLSNALPQWMKDYFTWHDQQRQGMKGRVDWSDIRLLIIRCASVDRCGGTSDRLKALPLFLLLAAKSDRLLLIRWERPFALEEFLVPGPLLNWSVPIDLLPWLEDSTGNNTRELENRVYHDGLQVGKLIKATQDQSIWLVEGNVHTGGVSVYRKQIESETKKNSVQNSDADYNTFYHDMFHGVFLPSPQINKMVNTYMTSLNLLPNNFSVAHYRAKYPGEPYRETWDKSVLETTTWNAITCASSLAPGYPIYVASDTVAALQSCANFSRNHPSHGSVVTHLDASDKFRNNSIQLLPHQDPLHLNFAKPNDASGFYSIFVDLFIMANSRCVSFGAGGFGRFGSLVSHNASCRVAHSIKGKVQVCKAG